MSDISGSSEPTYPDAQTASQMINQTDDSVSPSDTPEEISPLEQSIVDTALGPIPDPPSIPEQVDPLPATDIPVPAAPVAADPTPEPVQSLPTPEDASPVDTTPDPAPVSDPEPAEAEPATDDTDEMTEVVEGVFIQQTVIGSLSSDDIESRFGFHKATIEGPESSTQKHADLRNNFKVFAQILSINIPGSREASLMFTALEEASMWAHKAIAKYDEIDTEA